MQVMGMIKDRNSKDLTEKEKTKKRQQDYIYEIYKKMFLMTHITTVV